MIKESFLVCFVQFYFLTQTDDFAKAIAHGWRPFLSIFKMVSFFEYLIFLKDVLSNFILTQTNDFAKAIAHGWRLFLPICKIVLIFLMFGVF